MLKKRFKWFIIGTFYRIKCFVVPPVLSISICFVTVTMTISRTTTRHVTNKIVEIVLNINIY